MRTVDEFSRELTDSGLMSVEQLQTFCDTLPPDRKPQTADQLSRQLIEKDVLTEYQVGVLSLGGGKPLVFGDYVVLEEIGAGGMGVVFKAQHRRMKRVVALKMLPSELSEEESALRRFEREVEVAAKLNHRNVVAALDAREEQGTHYLIMEYVEGRGLSAIVESEGALPVHRAVDYTVQAATGCAYAHALGIIHRDIKPSNLLVDVWGVVKILDMGLARVDLPAAEGLAATRSHLTSPGMIMGTLDYLSPEQALNSHNVDHRTDIYSLGCTLYYLLTGRPIYAGDTPMQKLVAHREQPIPSLHDTREDLPAALNAAYQRMVAKRIEDRFQSMTDVIQALQGCLSSATETGAGSRVAARLAVDDGPMPVLAQVIEEAGPGLNAAGETDGGAGTRHRLTSRANASHISNRVFLVLIGRSGGAILGGLVGANLGGQVGVLTAVIGAMIYIWFGWRCGGGYAWMFAHLQGWSDVPPESKAGRLFQTRKLPWHVVALVIGGIVGIWTGGFWRGIFIALTALALADRLRLPPIAS